MVLPEADRRSHHASHLTQIIVSVEHRVRVASHDSSHCPDVWVWVHADEGRVVGPTIASIIYIANQVYRQ
jgi:hypothetical protein